MWSHEDDFNDLVFPIAQEWNVDPAAILATIGIESSFNPGATRFEPRLQDTSYGLMQVLSSTAAGMGYPADAGSLLDPEINILAGTDYFSRMLISQFGDYLAAASRYNGGTPRGDGTFTNPDYVSKFSTAYEYFKKKMRDRRRRRQMEAQERRIHRPSPKPGLGPGPSGPS